MSRNNELHKIMEENKMGRRDVARLIGLKINKETGQAYTLANWLTPDTSTAHRQIPVASLMLLKLRLEHITDSERAKWEGPLDKAAIIAKNRKKRQCEQVGYTYADGVIKKRRTTRYVKKSRASAQ